MVTLAPFRGDVAGESAWGAVSRLLGICFPKPLSEPGVRLSPHRALHGCCRRVVWQVSEGVGDHRAPIPVAADRYPGGVKQGDLAGVDGSPSPAGEGEPAPDVLPPPMMLCSLPAHDPPPGVLLEVVEGAGGHSMSEVVGPTTRDLVDPDQRVLQIGL